MSNQLRGPGDHGGADRARLRQPSWLVTLCQAFRAKGRLCPVRKNTVPARNPQLKLQGGIVNRRPTHPRHSHRRRGTKSIIYILALGLLILCCSSTAYPSAGPSDSPDTLVWRSRTSFSSTELSVDLSQNRVVKFRACSDSDGCTACKASRRTLSAEEAHSLSRLARGAKLFSGRTTGFHVDFSFRWLEVRSGIDIAMLVTTVNRSFSVPAQGKSSWLSSKH